MKAYSLLPLAVLAALFSTTASSNGYFSSPPIQKGGNHYGLRIRGGTSTSGSGWSVFGSDAAKRLLESTDDHLQNALKHIDEVLGRNHIKLGKEKPKTHNLVLSDAHLQAARSDGAEKIALDTPLDSRPASYQDKLDQTSYVSSSSDSTGARPEPTLLSRPAADDSGYSPVSSDQPDADSRPSAEHESDNAEADLHAPADFFPLKQPEHGALELRHSDDEEELQQLSASGEAEAAEAAAAEAAAESQPESTTEHSSVAQTELEARFFDIKEAFRENGSPRDKVAALREQMSHFLATQGRQEPPPRVEKQPEVQQQAPKPAALRSGEGLAAPKPFASFLATRTASVDKLSDLLGSLEKQVSTLQVSYGKLATDYGCPAAVESRWPTRTESYSCLDTVAMTQHFVEEYEEEEEEEAEAAAEARMWKEVQEQTRDDLGTFEPELPAGERLSIVIVSSEVTPFSKSGGLADVCDKLGVALSRMGHRVMTVAPLYQRYQNAQPTGARKSFNLFGQKLDIEYWHNFEETVPESNGRAARGVDHVFVSQGCFERHGFYGHSDDLNRFALLAWAALEAPFAVELAGSVYGDEVVFLLNDWMVGLVPLIMASHYRRYGCYKNARTVFDIHNMGYCGNFPICNPQELGLPDDAFFNTLFHDGQIKLLKSGIELSDRVVTVSPSYKEEIITVEGGFGLNDRCASRLSHLDGVLNGIDVNDWNPATDPFLGAKFQGFDNFYSAADLSGKKGAKAHLQSCFHLPEDPNVPIIAFIGRLAYQKGLDILESVFPWLMSEDHEGVTGKVQVIMMGSGEQKYADFLQRSQGEYHGRVGSHVGFTSELEHKILSGADILVMPSRYEPCGLPQLYAQRYGTVPVVHATGGLKDSVVQYDPFQNAGTGWKFDKADGDGLKYGLWNALNTYKHHPQAWQDLIQRCMAADFSWEKSAARYVEIFNWAKIDQPFINPHPF